MPFQLVNLLANLFPVDFTRAKQADQLTIFFLNNLLNLFGGFLALGRRIATTANGSANSQADHRPDCNPHSRFHHIFDLPIRASSPPGNVILELLNLELLFGDDFFDHVADGNHPDNSVVFNNG